MRSIAMFVGLAVVTAEGHASAQQVVQVIYSPNPNGTGEFGFELASEGDLLVVGAPGELSSRGRAYVYHRPPGQPTWQFASELQLPSPTVPGDFGEGLAMVGTRVVVTSRRQFGPPGASGNGAIHIFELADPYFPLLVETVFATGGSEFASLGHDVAMNDRWLVSGSILEDDPAGNWTGAVYAFERVAGAWVQRERITPPGLRPGDRFGWRVALDGDLLLASSVLEDNLGCSCGAAHLFDLSTSPPTQLARIDRTHALPGATFDTNFGQELHVDQHQVLVGDVGSSPPAIYRYVPDPVTGTWAWDTTFTASEPGGFNLHSVLAEDRFVLGRNTDVTGPGQIPGRYVMVRRCRGHWTQTDAAVVAPTGLQGPSIGGFKSVVNDDHLIAGAVFVTQGNLQQSGAVLIWDVATLFDDPTCASLGDPVCLPAPGQCPCTAAPPVGSEAGCTNSTGNGARLRAIGQPSVSYEDLLLVADDLPVGSTALFALSPGWTVPPASPALQGGGISCMLQPPSQTFVTVSNAGGIATLADPLPTNYALVGMRMLAEVRYRDTAAASCGTGFNVTNGLVFWVMR